MPMEGKSMSEKELQPEVIVFAGPNGSGKSTITKLAKTGGIYINADDIKRANHCSDIEAAQIAEGLREQCVEDREKQGGHGVPDDKIRTRYERCLKLIPELISVCDVIHIYDNTQEPSRIFKRRNNKILQMDK